jgi:hypothetical protein
MIVTANNKPKVNVKIGSPAQVIRQVLVVIIIVIILQPAGWC